MFTGTGFQRIFLIFANEDGGYETGQKPSGYIKMETRDGKGKGSLSVQNLRPGNDRFQYRLYLIKNGGADWKAVSAGRIAVGQNKAELEWSFDPLNVGGSGTAIGEFDIAAVLVEQPGNPPDRVICPLVAYKGKKAEWRNGFRSWLKQRKMDEATAALTDQADKPYQGYPEQMGPVQQPPMQMLEIADVESERPPFLTNMEMKNMPGQYKQNSMPEWSNPIPIPEEAIQDTMPEQAVSPGMNYIPAEDPQAAYPQIPFPQNYFPAAYPQTEQPQMSYPPMNYPYGQGYQEYGKIPMQNESEAGSEIEPESNPMTNPDAGMETKTELESGFQTITKEDAAEENQHGIPETEIEQGEENLIKEAYQPTVGQIDTGCIYLNGNMCNAFVDNGFSSSNPCASCHMHNGRSTHMEPPAGNVIQLREELDRYFEQCDPFHSHRSDYTWWRVGNPVNLNNLLYQCNIRSPLLFNPAVMMAHYKYRHLIVGIFLHRARDKQYVVCGVPGMSMVDKKPFGDMSRWVQAEGNRPRYGAFGYWLVYIDPDGGKILDLNQ